LLQKKQMMLLMQFKSLTNIEPDYQEEEEASDYGAGPTPASESGLN
jgi:hypothetical protein